jgi:hypothetical protein
MSFSLPPCNPRMDTSQLLYTRLRRQVAEGEEEMRAKKSELDLLPRAAVYTEPAVGEDDTFFWILFSGTTDTVRVGQIT